MMIDGAHNLTATVKVPAKPETSYDVLIGAGLLPRVLPDAAAQWPELRPFVVTDANVRDAGHLAALVGEADVDAFVITPPGEPSKTIHTVEAIIDQLERDRYGRDTLLIALGGGTVGDMGGFAAAIFKRGVPYVQAPTSTVAQADSAIGGKVGVDSDLSKNAYGAFKNPVRVYMDCDTLQTLDERHYRAGLVESIKHAMIADVEYFEYIESHLDALLARETEVLLCVSEKNCAIKGDVVYRDPEEANLRRILNFGHTIGHAVESGSGYALLHGEAVAIGIVGACRIAEGLGIATTAPRERVMRIFERMGLPTTIPNAVNQEELVDAMSRDKKSRARRPRFALIQTLGTAHCPKGQIAVEVPKDLVTATLQEMRAL
ncbi:3-dehydroquinate synthase [bacterium]|nr:3-dehydroquinate synthase [bacterium]